MERVARLKESIWDIWTIVKTCMTTVWFWVPVIFALYMWAQLAIMFYIHPLALIVVPSILVVYALVQEDKRIKLQYGLGKEETKKTEADLKEVVNEYKLLLNNDKKPKEIED